MNAIVREPKCLKRSNKVTDTESSKISCGIRIMRMHSLTNTNMHSLSKMTKPYSQENKTRQRKFRLQMSIAKCYKAESLKLKPHNSYAEASFCCADIQANLLSHGIFPHSDPSFPVQTHIRLKPPSAMQSEFFSLAGRKTRNDF